MKCSLGGIVKKSSQVILLCLCITASGCGETETRETVDDTVEEMAGKKDLDRYRQMKDDIGEIEKQQSEKYRQLDE